LLLTQEQGNWKSTKPELSSTSPMLNMHAAEEDGWDEDQQVHCECTKGDVWCSGCAVQSSLKSHDIDLCDTQWTTVVWQTNQVKV
jgi:hypothetical protein